MPTKPRTTKTLPATKVTNAFKAAKEEAKKLLGAATKKFDAAKKAYTAAAKKLKVAQADLKKLEGKYKKDNSKTTAKRVAAAKKRCKQAELVHGKDKGVCDHAKEIATYYRDHLRKLEHLNKLVNAADRDWEQAKKASPAPSKKKAAA